MSAADDRCRQVERELVVLGIRARVESVGKEDAIALVCPEGGTIEDLLSSEGREEIIDACRAAGFRNAAIELFWE